MIYTEDYKIKYINKFSNVRDFGLRQHGGNINCIFHEDVKPSAHVYSNNSFYCFKCHRHFYPINIIWKLNLNINNVFDNLFKEYGHYDFKIEENKKEEVIVTREGKNIIESTKEFFGV
jgi:hypothetical protein